MIAVNPAFQPFLAGYPGWNASTKRLTSPLLFDSATKIGRSASLTTGSVGDTTGVPVGSANTVVSEGSFSLVPPLYESPKNTFEVHTEVRSLNMTGGGTAVRAGTAAADRPGSYGEVESLAGPVGDPYFDFPAKSFFDIFVDVDLPPGGGIPAAFTVHNTQPLIVQNNSLTAFPPKVVYIHDNSTAVPVVFNTAVPAIGANAGDTFGVLLLAGHGINYTPTQGDESNFVQTVTTSVEAPVAPQYATWATGLNVPLQLAGLKLQTGGTLLFTGYCTPNTTLLLQSTPSLTQTSVWSTVNEALGTSNATFSVTATKSSATSMMFYRMLDNTR